MHETLLESFCRRRAAGIPLGDFSMEPKEPEYSGYGPSLGEVCRSSETRKNLLVQTSEQKAAPYENITVSMTRKTVDGLRKVAARRGVALDDVIVFACNLYLNMR